jgi:hypothetical protein
MAQFPIEQPQGFSPFPIESVLAQGMMDPAKSGVAAALMAGYQGMRQGNQAQYSQHVAANQALAAQQLQIEARNKAIANVLAAMKQSEGTPGTFQALQSNPLFAGMFEGNPQAYQAMIQSIARNAAAQNMQRAGAGANHLVDAGFAPSVDTMSDVTGVPLTKAVPLSLQRAAMSNHGSSSKDELTVNAGNYSARIRRSPDDDDASFARKALAMQLALEKARLDYANGLITKTGPNINNGNMTPSQQQRIAR